MPLGEFSFNSFYDKLHHNIGREFYLPCMRNSLQYDRITGYFSSAIYVIAWSALKEFVLKGGRMRIICSPFLGSEDIAALSEGNASRLGESASDVLKDEFRAMLSSSVVAKPARILACLIAEGVLDVRIVVPGSAIVPSVRRLFHDKVGVFYDGNGDRVAFRGSFNETYGGLANDGNIESIDVFQSWDGGKELERVEGIEAFFDDIWSGNADVSFISELPDDMVEEIGRIARESDWMDILGELDMAREKTVRWLPPDDSNDRRIPRQHQVDALESWAVNGYRGILEHATGSGKTFTAVCAIRDALRRGKRPIVLVPSADLLKQWVEELGGSLKSEGVKVLACSSKQHMWRNKGVLNAWTSPRASRPAVVVVTMDTAVGDAFASGVFWGSHVMVVADEAHRLGSHRRSKFFSFETGDRLGLSATPVRFGDPVGTGMLMSYFGGVLEPKYSLGDAIRDGVLTRYFYYPKTVSLSPCEQEEWDELTKKINRLYARIMHGGSSNDYDTLAGQMKRLVLRRARVAKRASGKVKLAFDVISARYERGQRWIVYCDDQGQLKDVLDLLRAGGIDAYEYHSAMDGDRSETLSRFSVIGGVLVSIRCLDEGIDVPSVTHALVLASSRNPREFVQRRGRILRKADGKMFAYLFDAIVVPYGAVEDVSKSVSLVEAEISRAVKFGEWAENPSCLSELKNIALDYGIDIDECCEEGGEQD